MNARTWLRAEWDRVTGFALVGLGALLLILGYLGVRESPFIAEQLAYMASGGLGGIFSLGLGVGLLLSADLHDEWRKLDRIEAALRGTSVPDAEDVLDLVTGRRHEAGAPGGGSPAVAAVPSGASRQGANLMASTAVALDWRGDRLRRGLLVSALGLLAPLWVMGMGWRRARYTADMDVAARGLGFVLVGLLLAVAVIAGYSLWLRWRVTARKSALFGSALQRVADDRRPVQPAAAGEELGTGVLVAPELRRFHRPGCPILAGVQATLVARQDVDPALSGCGICDAQ